MRSESPSLASTLTGEEPPEIDHHALNQEEARRRFQPASERQYTISTRVKTKRKEHRSSQGRHPRQADDLMNGVEVSSEDEPESLERKFARLRRELTEVKDDLQEQKLNANESSQIGEAEYESQELNDLLDIIEGQAIHGKPGMTARLLQQFSTLSDSSAVNGTRSKADIGEGGARNENTKTENDDSTAHESSLSLVHDFDTRLRILEDSLGTELAQRNQQSSGPTKPLLPTMDKLDKQLSILSRSTDRTVDQLAERIHELVQETAALETKQAQVKPVTQKGLTALENAMQTNGIEITENAATMSKVNALYGTLGIIESMAPLLPSVLDRLRSLKELHANAGSAGQNLTELERDQADMKEEIHNWREALEKAETAMMLSQKSSKENLESIEGWVRDLEHRLKDLS